MTAYEVAKILKLKDGDVVKRLAKETDTKIKKVIEQGKLKNLTEEEIANSINRLKGIRNYPHPLGGRLAKVYKRSEIEKIINSIGQ